MEKKYNYFLLVDDNKAINFVNKMTLSKLNLAEDIRVAKNGQEALEVMINYGLPELVFLDINMPVMNGWEFLNAYKKIDASMSKSKIVLTTGISLDTQEEKMATTKFNITNFCGKTLDKNLLLDLFPLNLCKAEQIEYIYN